MATLQHTDELYHILEDEICALKILPGEALSENQLCKRFGVSRTPIRSVLQRLEQNGFVLVSANGSHYKYHNPTTNKTTVVPFHAKDLKPGTEKNILKLAGLKK